MSVRRLVSSVLLLVAILILPGSADAQNEPIPVDDYMGLIREEQKPVDKMRHLKGFIQDLEDREYDIEPEKMTLFFGELLEDSKDAWLVVRLIQFLTENPRPAAANALANCARREDIDPLLHWMALEALVIVDGREAFFILVKGLESTPRTLMETVIRLLSETGQPEAVPILLGISEDPKYFKQLKTIESDANYSKTEETIRLAARHALKRLQFQLETGIMCPFDLDDRSLEKIKENGFAIRSEKGEELYEFYGVGEFYWREYSFVTTDVVLRAFMIIMREALKDLELLLLRPKVADFSLAMTNASLRQAENLSDVNLARSARRNAAFFAVPAMLLGRSPENDDGAWPADVKKAAVEEVARITAHDGVHPSGLFDYKEDFTRYEPRGRHASQPELGDYYRAMLYYGRMYFPLKSDEDTRRALLLVDLLRAEPRLRDEWVLLDSLLGRLIGERDDACPLDYEAIAKALTGEDEKAPCLRVAEDPDLLRAFQGTAGGKNEPHINTDFVHQKKSWRGETASLRLFGQRYNRPAHLFQQLIEKGIWPPSGLHVVAELLGSKSAAEILRERGIPHDPDYYRVPEPPDDPYRGLSEGTIHVTRALFDPPPGVPAFMKTAAWEEKEINTALAGWAEVSALSAPFIKDSLFYYAVVPLPDKYYGYVEPIPEFYARLDSLVQSISSLYERFGIYHVNNLERYAGERICDALLGDFSDLLFRLCEIAEKELQGELLSGSDLFFLKRFKGNLKRFSFSRHGVPTAPAPMAFLCDVATEYESGECLQIGAGRPRAIYVAIPDGDRMIVCKGAVYSYYEFTRPITDRVTAEEWIEMNWEGADPGPPVSPLLPGVASVE